MYGRNHKSVRETKSKKNTQNPSFSSTLLDEIYRSMDGGDEKSSEFKLREEKQSVGARAKASSVVEDEGMASHRRPFLVEKWMDMKTFTGRTRPSTLPEFHRKLALDNDPVFLSSGSSSSDSSFGWFSEPDGFCDSRSHKPSCFSKPKPIKTDAFSKKHQKMELDYCSNDDQTTNGALIKSKSRALKIYANLKKVKHPISPGGRLTTFLNSLFANGNVKKPKDSNSSGFDNKKIIERTTHGSTCSSASSFTRSCLSKNSPRSREKLNNGIRRTVRFYPVSVIIDQDSRPCGKKFIRDEEDFTKYNEDDDYSYDEDTSSDSSSDLFELDHLSILKERDEELPVYETTHFGTNRAIANGLIC
ncbi:protein BIG GRAIN 1-like B [Cynara cardunculus var. scolymus]|uniref:Protein BIG GRAIN 1-like B n=1 Tax=Cynara cardunculus var. scolymus TaxID=59895 RepID=A0A118K711_CYNCS|nr:protein BIG GRAIN 1-like B [Cynara cardunculus var. scolymus]KVI11520.1 hypothetical protein Ccrd_010069 [Cynara cardunculus var. scolymus]